MIFLSRLKEKTKEIFELCKGVLSGFLPNFSVLKKVPGVSQLKEKFGNRLFLIVGLGSLILFLLVIMIIVAVSGPRQSDVDDTSAFISAGYNISIDELFLPREPDFTPEFFLEQEPRSVWSIEDIRPHWRSLSGYDGIGDSSIWQNEIRSAVDRIMEGVR